MVLSLVLASVPLAPAVAQDSLTNTVTVTPAPSVVDGTPGNNTATADVVVSAAATYDFCPTDGQTYSVDSIEDIWRHTPNLDGQPELASIPAVPSSGLFPTALMVDPARNRLLFAAEQVGGSSSLDFWVYDGDGGGWSSTDLPNLSDDLGGVAPDGRAYLLSFFYPGVTVRRLDPDPGSTAYTVTELGLLVFDEPPAPNAASVGDLAFDADGVAWIVAGNQLYTVNLSAGDLTATKRADLSTIGRLIQGVSFTADGRLLLGTHGFGGTPAYYFYDPTTGEVTDGPEAAEPTITDLASCATPRIAAPESLTVTKTLAQVNGTAYVAGEPVLPGDTLTYNIRLANGGGMVANLAPGEVDETLPDHTTVVASGDNDFTCSGTTCPNTAAINIPAGDSVDLGFVVEVVDPLPAGASNIHNAVAVVDVDCSAAGNDCVEDTAIGSTVTVAKSSDVGDGTPVAAGDTITYTVTVSVANAATPAPVVVTDTLGDGLTFGEVSSSGQFTCSSASASNLTCTLPDGAVAGDYPVVYTATVDLDASTSVTNSVVTDTGTCTACTTTNPLQTRITVAKSADPASGSTVLPGATLAYTLAVNIANAATTQELTLVDTLSPGLTFVAVTDAGDFNCSGALNCMLPVNTTPGNYTVTYTATVDADATGTVGNSVAASNGQGIDPPPVCTSCTTEHTVVPTEISVSKSANPASGSTVLPGETIEYTLAVTVANSNTTQALVLEDTLGAGLTFAEVTDAGAFDCTGGLNCTLPSGSSVGMYTVTYTAAVDDDATGTVGNSVLASNPPGGDPDPACTTCSTEHTIAPAETSVSKTANPATRSTVLPGDTIEYTLRVTVANSNTTEDLTLVDTLGPGLTFDAVTDAGGFDCTGGLTCTLPAGAANGAHTLTYTATVDADATGTVGNSVVASNPPGGDPDPACTACTTEHIVVPAETTVSKTANPATGSTVLPGDTIEYTLAGTVANSNTTQALTLVDTLGSGLTFGAVTDAGAFSCSSELTCTLPADTPADTYAVTYTATIDADATGTVGNSVVASNPPGGDPDPTCTTCTTEHTIAPAETTVTKTANPATGSTVVPGDTIEYTLAVTVANSNTTEALTLTDTLSDGLTFGAVTDAGAFDCTGGLTCTLPAGTSVGTYAVSYTAMVDADATGTVANSVVATNPASGDPDPTCATCATQHEIEPVAITVVKSADPAAGAEVRVGDTIAYTVAVTVANSVTTQPFTLTDTLGPGLVFGQVTDAGAFTCSGTLECLLPAGTLPGLYQVAYTATVSVDARTQVRNDVTAAGGGTTPDCSNCSVEHPVADPRITISKSSDPASGSEVRIGDSIEYTLTALVEDSSTLDDAFLVDAPGTGLDIETLPAGCTISGAGFRCALPAGTAPGTSTFTYTAIVNADAGDTVLNLLTGESEGTVPECEVCETTHRVIDETALRITKTVSARTARIGDLLRYTLTIENVGTRNLVGGTVLDTPPAGFVYVDGSMSVADGDGAFTLSPGLSPLRIGGLDIATGGQATVVYLLRVGAGVRAGVYVNEAVAVDASDDPVSNVATAQVVIESDPMLDDSLVFGTVFDDRDADGWQDSAALGGVHVQGGFNPDAYIAGTTTVDRGQGPVPQADASAPLLHGIQIGAIAGRQSVADAGAARQIVIRQRLREPTFTGDFVLTSDQGLTLHMDAQGNTSIERDGDAARGIGAGEPVVERSIARVQDGYEVAYA
ncbi:MAG: isopeptide-forming domain-containing fimbrial protein, partial [Actinomycetota bacterium]|nr:isopeptide-forming domain-containing fimbrial protein [Actinomycetota bacterium]